MTSEQLKDLIEDLRLNHEFCPKEVILQSADELERIMGDRQLIEDLLSALKQEHALHDLARLGQEIEQAEPTCPECKAKVLFECVACSSNNYPPQQQAEPPLEWLLIKNILDEYGLDAIAFVAEWKEAQRPWQGLTPEEVKHLYPYGRSVWGRETFEAIEKALKEKNSA